MLPRSLGEARSEGKLLAQTLERPTGDRRESCRPTEDRRESQRPEERPPQAPARGADAWGSRGQAGRDVSSAQSRGTCPCEFHRPVPREALAANPGDGAPATASRDRDGTPGTRPEALPPGTDTALAAPQLPGLSRARPSGRTAAPRPSLSSSATQLQATQPPCPTRPSG